MSRELIGDSMSRYPQRLEEVVHPDISSLILNQPLDLAIEHLQTFLRTSRHEKLTLESGYSFHNSPGKMELKGVRSETEAEVLARLEKQRGYLVSGRDRVLREISELETQMESLRKKAEVEEQKLQEFSKM